VVFNFKLKISLLLLLCSFSFFLYSSSFFLCLGGEDEVV